MSKLYKVEYLSVNHYENPIKNGVLDLLIMPFQNEEQEIQDVNLRISPRLKYLWSQNHLGFKSLRLFIDMPIKDFTIHFKAIVRKTVQSISEKNNLIQEADEDFYRLNYFYLQQTKLTLIPKHLVNLKFEKETALWLPYLLKIAEYVSSLIEYKQHVTSVFTTAADALHLKAGVCQDFAHILIGFYRANNIYARYVSGYLHTEHYEAQHHAWVEVYVMNNGWVGIDPANNCLVNENYIKIAHGVDYSECAAIKGTIASNGRHTTNYKVKVAHFSQQILQIQA